MSSWFREIVNRLTAVTLILLVASGVPVLADMRISEPSQSSSLYISTSTSMQYRTTTLSMTTSSRMKIVLHSGGLNQSAWETEILCNVAKLRPVLINAIAYSLLNGTEITGAVHSSYPINFYVWPSLTYFQWRYSGPYTCGPGGKPLIEYVNSTSTAFDLIVPHDEIYYFVFVRVGEQVPTDLTFDAVKLDGFSQFVSVNTATTTIASEVAMPTSLVTNPSSLTTVNSSGQTGLWLDSVLMVGFVSSIVVLTLRKRKRRSEQKQELAVAGKEIHASPIMNVAHASAEQTLPIGFADLEKLLPQGIPLDYTVLLISPPCDERDLLLRKMVSSELSTGMRVFYVSSDSGRTRELLRSFPENLYVFCPDARRDISDEKYLFAIPDVSNLVEFNILLNKGVTEHVGDGERRIIVMDLLSELLYRYKAAVTRKWLAGFLSRRKTQQFTIICTLNSAMVSKDDTSRILDLFDGIIEIYEKETEGRTKRFLVIRKMYGQDYSESELLLERSKLM